MNVFSEKLDKENGFMALQKPFCEPGGPQSQSRTMPCEDVNGLS